MQLLLAEPGPRGLPRGLPVLSVPVHEPIRVPLPPVGGLPASLLQVSPGHSLPRLLLLSSDLLHSVRLLRRLWGLSPRTQNDEGNDHGSSVRGE